MYVEPAAVICTSPKLIKVETAELSVRLPLNTALPTLSTEWITALLAALVNSIAAAPPRMREMRPLAFNSNSCP